ncbi:hypothetical protein EJB05_56525, partial [Eragrostis curvula]
MVENTKRLIQIDDMEAHVFKSLRHFIYRDALPDVALEESSDVACDAVSMAQHLLVAADRYNVERLKMICKEKLRRNEVSQSSEKLREEERGVEAHWLLAGNRRKEVTGVGEGDGEK